MGQERAEAFNWELQDVAIYPTGGGTGLIGMWKSFKELENLGWINQERPGMVCVKAEGCAHILHAFDKGADRAQLWEGAQTMAAGLRAPVVFADQLILRALHESQEAALVASDEEILETQHELASEQGIIPVPERAANLASLHHLQRRGWVFPEEAIVLFSTGNGLKYL